MMVTANAAGRGLKAWELQQESKSLHLAHLSTFISRFCGFFLFCSFFPQLSDFWEARLSHWRTCGDWESCSQQCKISARKQRPFSKAAAGVWSLFPNKWSPSEFRFCPEHQCLLLPQQQTLGISKHSPTKGSLLSSVALLFTSGVSILKAKWFFCWFRLFTEGFNLLCKENIYNAYWLMVWAVGIALSRLEDM